YTRGDVW
nr:immunoglobulin heavy chain junction region [Macaca mulatta]MOV48851.1 immunoglobulin heavy chain junction region [Macaca mulatta]MOV49054.1 immunoglobulin heavy chain junction region [Macaca mulatta]MOV49077.1 immunoglobulin heavy chain junction region [Macaca mulatta]MOV49103.1 immunoglobulin heavy chain junction region [Macaca mulatta]